MKHIETIQKPCLKNSLAHGGCGECQASFQSACKTSCTVANQSCANKENQIRLAIVSGSGQAKAEAASCAFAFFGCKGAKSVLAVYLTQEE